MPEFHHMFSLLFLCPLEGTQEAAPQLSPRPRRNLHKQALHGPTEDNGGGEGARSAGLPQP